VLRWRSPQRISDVAAQLLSPHEHDVTILWRRGRHSAEPCGLSGLGLPGIPGGGVIRLALLPFGLSSLAETLRQVAATQPLALAVATIDSALRRTALSPLDLLFLAQHLPKTLRKPFELADGRSDSGTESVMRVLLLEAGLKPRLQVPIPLTDLDRIDILVGDRLVIECDSRQFHGGPDQRLRDLRRDADLAALGFIVLRFDYAQVFGSPETVLAAVLEYVRLGLHLGTGSDR
jgi:very-short-patch-repair endonuclease